MKLIDIGCNLTSKRLLSDKERIIHEAHEAGVFAQVLTGTDRQSNEKSIKLAETYNELFATVGHHPHHADHWDSGSDPNHLETLAVYKEVVAVGEMGLDYNRNFSTKENQIRCFKDQLEVATKVGKPVFLHEREAYDDFMATLKPYLPKLKGAVWHCFTGNATQLEEAIELGLYIGITGWICDPKRGKSLQRIVDQIPNDRLMLETDAPYLTPKNIQPTPRTNEPKYLTYVLDKVAECRKQSKKEVAAFTTQNAINFFNLDL